jgi:hypothetical protein
MEKVKYESCLTWDKLARIVNLSSRTLRDWRREVLKMNYEKAKILSEFTKVPLPKIKKILPEYWSVPKAAKAGGLARLKIYGPPGTPEGRSKGGKRSQELRRLYPEKYPHIIVEKKIRIPEISKDLAEFIGIMIGDGQLTKYQIGISLNTRDDSKYIQYVSNLIKRLFGVSLFIRNREGNCTVIKVSSTCLVRYLNLLGLPIGNKIENNIDIPNWIFNKKEFMKGCIRGLLDTDGNISRKNYHAKTLALQIIFTSASEPLLKSVRKIFFKLGYNPSKISYRKIYLTRFNEIHKYVKEIGFSNSKHMKRYKNYLSMFNH